MTSPSTHYSSRYINGQWVQAQSPDTLPVYDNAPSGGDRQSGNGREKGRDRGLENGVYGFEEFLEFKSFQLKPAVV